ATVRSVQPGIPLRSSLDRRTTMKKLGFIGGGNMAEALIRGLLAKRMFTSSELIASDIDRNRRQRLKRIFKIDVSDSNSEAGREARAMLIAVKPQSIDEVLSELKAGAEPSGSQQPVRIHRTDRTAVNSHRRAISAAAQ